MKLIKTTELPWVGVSHNPDIKKKVFISKDEIPSLMNFSTATFTPGQSVEPHAHETMVEVFYITAGSALFTISGQDHVVTVGDCVVIEAKEIHAMSNPNTIDASWLYFGVAV